MRASVTLLACALAMPAAAGNGPWQVTAESPEEIVAVDLSSFQRQGNRVGFRQRHTLRGGQTDPHSLRPLREVLVKRMVDCRARRVATLSRAVFDNQDALIDHQAVQPDRAAWQPLAKRDPVFRLVCSRS